MMMRTTTGGSINTEEEQILCGLLGSILENVLMRSLDEIATMTTQGHEENEYGSDVRMLQRSDTVQIALFF